MKSMFKDPVLQTLSNSYKITDIESTQSVFHDLNSCIVEQQIHYRSSKKTFEKMLQQAGLKLLTLENFEIFESMGLLKQKLSIQKYESLLCILDFFTDQTIDFSTLSDQEVRQTLTQIKGVSDWTADMILIYTLKRPDVFPSKDYHLRKLLEHYFPQEAPFTPGKVKKKTAEWQPHRSAACLLLLATKG